jgi:hypothetical protein
VKRCGWQPHGDDCDSETHDDSEVVANRFGKNRTAAGGAACRFLLPAPFVGRGAAAPSSAPGRAARPPGGARRARCRCFDQAASPPRRRSAPRAPPPLARNCGFWRSPIALGPRACRPKRRGNETRRSALSASVAQLRRGLSISSAVAGRVGSWSRATALALDDS